MYFWCDNWFGNTLQADNISEKNHAFHHRNKSGARWVCASVSVCVERSNILSAQK
jgi:hypothetical protein